MKKLKDSSSHRKSHKTTTTTTTCSKVQNYNNPTLPIYHSQVLD
ncbi:hypothetical protein DFA_11285 [Cavenderia fasciculata]|uniref:Uncharacterized protein n=1 Tax=Cavenderia fasciculata TaxID=261658 RepID=F4QC37_CACFS|nr:uncharacterized protein DFA_11285 [Cavenderia fasciculata]EGG13524.1 hypothetical protein DFA_11285 [Cavenderia fasciculata]|eukprot:XP_004350228.1 hypothetical protein DFA_11285 [Cavenderia fasciculata]